jgi:hypothetical protein
MTPGGVVGVSGGVVGISFVFSMLGQGGGMVYMPLFHWVGLSIKALAIPLGIILSATAKVFSLPQYQRQHLIDWRAAWPMMLAVLAGALLGARLTGIVPAEALIWSFALVLLVAAVRTLWVVRQPEPNTELPWVRRALLGALVAGVAGFVGGLVGIAGGFIISPVLIWMGFGSKKSAAPPPQPWPRCRVWQASPGIWDRWRFPHRCSSLRLWRRASAVSPGLGSWPTAPSPPGDSSSARPGISACRSQESASCWVQA